MSDKPIHTYDDDIRELDNELPLWWRGILYGTIIFATCYWIWFQVLRAGENPIDAYKAEKYAIAQEEAKKLAAEGELTGDKLEAMSRNVAIVERFAHQLATTIHIHDLRQPLPCFGCRLAPCQCAQLRCGCFGPAPA